MIKNISISFPVFQNISFEKGLMGVIREQGSLKSKALKNFGGLGSVKPSNSFKNIDFIFNDVYMCSCLCVCMYT